MKFYELSSAHLQDDSKAGVAILSQYEILDSYEIKLRNPNISYNKNGKNILSDDKGFLAVEIQYNGNKIKVITGHMLPFHSLGSDSIYHKELYQEMYNKVKPYGEGSPFVLCGDFNSSKLNRIIEELYTDMNSVFDEATRFNGHQNDYIFISKEWLCESYSIDINDYDHFLCVCEIKLKCNNELKFLHLSDVHYLSQDHLLDIKTRLPGIKESDVRKVLFSNRIKSVSEEGLNYVIVSGDITTGGKKEGFKLFEDFVHYMQENKVFPPSNHFIIVPGNHDVDKDNRWANFANLLGGNFVRPWIEGIDEEPNKLLDQFLSYFKIHSGSLYGFFEDKVLLQKVHFPFVLDINNHIFIYAFNSSSISRTNIVLEENDQKFLDKIKSKKMSRDVINLINILEKELKIDPARVDFQELFLFGEFVKIISKKIDLSIYYKIAILHHHTTTISCTEEIKKFDNIINAGKLKKILSDSGFQIIMHGHKHSASVFYDTAIDNHKKILVVSGGTVFGYPNGRENGFYFHTINGKLLHSQYVYLDESKDKEDSYINLNSIIDTKHGISLSEIYQNIEYRVIQHINREMIDGKMYTDLQ